MINGRHANNQEINEILSKIKIKELGLSIRIENILYRHGLQTALDIIKMKESNYFTKIRGVGSATIKEIDNTCNRLIENIEQGKTIPKHN